MTAAEAGLANQGTTDTEVLAFAASQGRVVLTMNRRDFRRLHLAAAAHEGIVLCSRSGPDDLAQRVHHAIEASGPLAGRCVNVRADRFEEIARSTAAPEEPS